MSKLFRVILFVTAVIFTTTNTVFSLTPLERKNLTTPFYDEEQSICGPPTSEPVPADIEANAKIVWDFLISKGMTEPQAAGVLGNIQVESGGTFDPRIVEYGYLNSRGEISRAGEPSSLDDNIPPDQPSLRDGRMRGQPGYGLVQWTDARKHALDDFATERGEGPGTLPLQLEFLWHELETGYKKKVLNPILATDSYEQASDIFLLEFESPHKEREKIPARRTNSLNWFTRFAGSDSSSSSILSSSSGCIGGSVTLDPNGCPSGPITKEDTVTVEGITVHPCISEEVARLVSLAREQDLELGGGGWRDPADQIRLRRQNCGTSDFAVYQMSPGACSPPTARPGSSNHERGSAVDFNCNGRGIPTRSSPCFIFLSANTSLENLPSEPWHWSINGR